MDGFLGKRICPFPAYCEGQVDLDILAAEVRKHDETIVVQPALIGENLWMVGQHTDGGIWRGPDIVKGLAIGADFCLVGRPFLYGVAACGLEGARRVTAILERELRYTRAMIGWAEGQRPAADQIVRRVPSFIQGD